MESAIAVKYGNTKIMASSANLFSAPRHLHAAPNPKAVNSSGLTLKFSSTGSFMYDFYKNGLCKTDFQTRLILS